MTFYGGALNNLDAVSASGISFHSCPAVEEKAVATVTTLSSDTEVQEIFLLSLPPSLPPSFPRSLYRIVGKLAVRILGKLFFLTIIK